MKALRFSYPGVQKVISGGQCGADLAGLVAAKEHGLETGGWAPREFRTLWGARPGLREYGLEATTVRNYQVRTRLNVQNSDATIRFATNFATPGELCTLRAIRKFNKPYFDVELFTDTPTCDIIDTLQRWLEDNHVLTLNVAGNADRDEEFGQHFHGTLSTLLALFKRQHDDHNP